MERLSGPVYPMACIGNPGIKGLASKILCWSNGIQTRLRSTKSDQMQRNGSSSPQSNGSKINGKDSNGNQKNVYLA